MNAKDFQELQVGDILRCRGKQDVVVLVEHAYDHSTNPAKEVVFEVHTKTGWSVRVDDDLTAVKLVVLTAREIVVLIIDEAIKQRTHNPDLTHFGISGSYCDTGSVSINIRYQRKGVEYCCDVYPEPFIRD